MVHYGTIASGNQVMRSATERDKISADLGGVLCFEMEAAGLMNSFPCLVIRGICDYSDSHKNKRWQPYAAGTAAACAKEVLSVMPPAEVAQTRKVAFAIASHEFLPLLYENTCIYEESKTRNRQRVPGTCEWFTNHSLFNQWNSVSDNQIPGLLYVTADPGCGKSVLSRYLIDEVLPQTGRTVCYFFFKDDFEQQKSSLSAICSVLHQLFDHHPHLLTDQVLTGYVNRGKGFFESFENLWHIFLLATANQETVCVLDALDECRDGDRKLLVDAICSISLSKTTQHGGPRFLLTSRPYEHIRAQISIQLTSMTSIHLQGDQGPTADAITEEIQLVLDSRINETAKFFCLEPDEEVLMRTQLASIPNRTYLWITLIFDGLMKKKSGISKSDIMDLLRKPPQSVYDVYEQILNKSPDRQDARRLLHIIIGAKRPLSLEEMSIALAFKNEQSVDSVSERIIPRSRIGTYVRGLCGLFAIVVDDKVYLLHQTAKEFLIHDDTRGPPRELRHNFDEFNRNDSTESYIWRQSITIANTNTVLAGICMLYLASEFSFKNPLFLEYAPTYWAVHYRQSPDNCQLEMAKMAKDLCMPSKQCSQWTTIYNQHGGHLLPESPLCLASAMGLEQTVKLVLLEEYSINIDSKNNSSSLMSPLRRLLQVKQSLKTKRGRTDDTDVQLAMCYAAQDGHQAVVKLLLRIKDSIKSKDYWYGKAPLWSAAVHGHEDMVKLLLQNKAGFEMKDSRSWTPLFCAAELGHAAVVKLLLDNKAEFEIKDNRGRTPLCEAAWYGHVGVVKVLLQRNADVNSMDKHSRTPLSFAVMKGYEAVVKLMLETGQANVNLKDVMGRTPLSYAADNGYEAIAKLLLGDKQITVDSMDNDGRSPLSHAAESGHEGMVNLLLNTGQADVNLKDYGGRTPLSYAAEGREEGVIRRLLEDERIDVDLTDKSGLSPLSYAAQSEYEGVVSLLLETSRASVNLKDIYGRTPLSYAIEKKHEAVIKLFQSVGSQ
ncbi:NACHT domain-containing protein isoform 1 [Curvularia clavata]|uniref:NACHT domain-containing protein isoform 1 n=1 Tax=Curvularia clavata TaxID=95742 RepID=A0A9Q8ZAD4_CURCL|nr:NACHT domain-containing protein isoform 1 [Curvularia clavata]